MKSDFMVKTAKIIEEVLARTCIDIDAEVIKALLQDELRAYYAALNEHYDDGYADGYDDGRAEAESDNEEAVESAYEKGYSLGYSDGHAEGHSEVRALISRSI